MNGRAVRWIFLALGAAHAGAGLFMLFTPGPFYDWFATFPPRNDHYTRDLATFYVALGVAFAAAAGRPSWRGAVLLLALVEYALHVANHLYDFGDPPDDWVAPLTTAVLVAGLAVLAILAYAGARRPRRDDLER